MLIFFFAQSHLVNRKPTNWLNQIKIQTFRLEAIRFDQTVALQWQHWRRRRTWPWRIPTTLYHIPINRPLNYINALFEIWSVSAVAGPAIVCVCRTSCRIKYFTVADMSTVAIALCYYYWICLSSTSTQPMEPRIDTRKIKIHSSNFVRHAASQQQQHHQQQSIIKAEISVSLLKC